MKKELIESRFDKSLGRAAILSLLKNFELYSYPSSELDENKRLHQTFLELEADGFVCRKVDEPDKICWTMAKLEIKKLFGSISELAVPALKAE